MRYKQEIKYDTANTPVNKNDIYDVFSVFASIEEHNPEHIRIGGRTSQLIGSHKTLTFSDKAKIAVTSFWNC